jgi:uncharacterized radical SAM superfamily Fe-S cluster-containing enzyme
MKSINYGICKTCRNRVPAEHVIRDGKVFLLKTCPTCGQTESLISTDAAVWQRKRELLQYNEEQEQCCSLNCHTCHKDHQPKIIFLDITNRCNMNCPICIANIPGMGYEFHPPLSYFENVLGALGRMNPRPTIELFGGEPTVRQDLFDIIDIARKNNLRVRIVTNGLKLADEDYCKKICDAKIPVLLGFDGLGAEIYDRLRKNPSVYEKKRKALENLGKFSKRKNTIMCCVARGINDTKMAELIQFCHDNSRIIGSLHLIPLTENWEEGTFQSSVTTTIEDVEAIINEAIPGEKVDFLPAGFVAAIKKPLSFFQHRELTFGGAHPNCESMTFLLSDGQKYHSANYFFNHSLESLAEEAVKRSKKIEAKLSKLDPKYWLQRTYGQLITIQAFGPMLLQAVSLKKLLKGNPLAAIMRIGWEALRGQHRFSEILRQNSNIPAVIKMVVLPFEEYHSIEGARLDKCPSAFAYEDPDTLEVKTVPVCSWSLYRDEVYRKIAARYGTLKPKNEPAAPAANV